MWLYFPSKCVCCFHLIRPYCESVQTITTMLVPRRTAVSRSWMFIMTPPSPQMASARRSGYASLAPIAPGSANPMEQKPLEMSTVLGSSVCR